MKYKELVLAGVVGLGCNSEPLVSPRGIMGTYNNEPARYVFEDTNRNGKYDCVTIVWPDAIADFDYGRILYPTGSIKMRIYDEVEVSALYQGLANK